jgi:hypothetical protein
MNYTTLSRFVNIIWKKIGRGKRQRATTPKSLLFSRVENRETTT